MTYFLTAISLEQQKLQKILDDFKNHVHEVQTGISTKVQHHYFQSLEITIKNFYHVEKQCKTRKVDLYLIPAIHNTAQPAEQILSELESLKASSMNLFVDMQQQISSCVDKGIETMEELFCAMQQYCEMQQTILKKEEQELVPMAQQVLPFDVWFSMSAKCLADQEKNNKRTKFANVIDSEKKLSCVAERFPMIEKMKPAMHYATT